MDKQQLRRSANKVVGGSDFMGLKDFMAWTGYSKTAACMKLQGLEHVPGTKKYFIPEIVDHLYKIENAP